jgi:hypothetical protein
MVVSKMIVAAKGGIDSLVSRKKQRAYEWDDDDSSHALLGPEESS